MKIQDEATSDKYAGHFFENDFEKIFLTSNSIVLSSRHHSICFAEMKKGEKATAVLSRALDALSSTGEVRIGPVLNVIQGRGENDYEKIEGVLEKNIKK